MMTTKAKLVAPQADVEYAAQIRQSSKSMSEAIRTLANEWGTTDRGRIGRALGIRYQWVRNVLITPISKK